VTVTVRVIFDEIIKAAVPLKNFVVEDIKKPLHEITFSPANSV